MYLNKNRSKFWQWALYVFGSLGALWCGWLGYTLNSLFLIITFQINVWVSISAAVLAYFLVWRAAPVEEADSYAEYLRTTGKFVWTWLEYIFEAGFCALLLWFQHPIIGAVYLASCILMARVRFEVKRQTYLATIKYKKTIA